jgi:O-acetyl-ADP-ribose deacetylase (regulator of RNase III)
MPLRIVRNDLLKMEVDAIVNPTDRRLSGAGNIDLKIHLAGKDELKRELASFGRCNVGDAILTHAYNLPCEYIIHTVGPIWNGDEKAFKAIECCYRNCLDLAISYDIESIAFPLIATGSFGCPADKAIQIAINTINSFLIDDDLDVYLVVYNSETFGISQKLVEDVKSYIEADTVEDERVQRIQQLLSFYEFNDIPLSKRPVGKIRISESIELADEGWRMPQGMPFGIDSCCSLEDGYFDDLIPELDKIKETNEDSFTYKLFKIIDDNKLKDSDVYNAAGISKMVFSNLRKGVIPKKKTVFQLCLTLPISIEQATDLLASAGYTFVLSNKFEKTIKKIIEAKNTTKLTRIDVIDLILYELGLPVFNSDL